MSALCAASRVVLAALLVTVAACSSTPPPPDWRMNARASLERAVDAALEGNTRLEALEFERARREVSATGRADLLARVELTRCAARTAGLDFDDCSAFAPLAADAGPAERVYAEFLSGRPLAADAAQLPEAYRGVAAGTVDGNALQRIEDPASRLIAAGVALRGARLGPGAAELAVETASAQGWRRPLAAWLNVQVRRAEAAGDAGETARLRRRLDILLGPERAPAR